MITFGGNGKVSENAYGKLMSYMASGELECDYRCQKRGIYNNYTLLAILLATKDYERALELVNIGASFTV